MILPCRRTFIRSISASVMAAPMATGLAQAATEAKSHIACNQFCSLNMYRRSGKDFNADLDAGFVHVNTTISRALEPLPLTPDPIFNRCERDRGDGWV